jgi:hypothetical protein
MPKRVRIRMMMTHNKDGYPVDYTAQNAREFNALKGIELIDARVNQNGELVAIFDLSASDPVTAEQRLRKFAEALLPAGEEPETVQVDTLPPSDSNVVPLPGLT